VTLDLRGPPRLLPGPPGAFQCRRRSARPKLPLPGQLHRPRLLLGGNLPATAGTEGEAPWEDYTPARRPRKQTDHAEFWLLRRGHAQVRLRQRLALLHRGIRPAHPNCYHRRQVLLRPRWHLPYYLDARLPPRHRASEEIPHQGPLADLLWSDPIEDRLGFHVNKKGAGCLYGHDIVEKFLRVNKLEKIVRGNQLFCDGYRQMFNEQLLTLFSAPNFCYMADNDGAMLALKDGKEEIIIFQALEDEDRSVPPRKAPPDYFL